MTQLSLLAFLAVAATRGPVALEPAPALEPVAAAGPDPVAPATTATYDIPVHRLDDFERRFAGIVRRAVKLGCAVPAYVTGPQATRPNPDRPGTVIVFRPVTITAKPVVLDGWTFLAAIEHGSDDAGSPINVFLAAPGANASGRLEPYRAARPDCDHCGTDRRRVQTYLVGHVDGRIYQVGSTCLSDFVGGHSANAAALAAVYFDAHAAGEQFGDDSPIGGGSAARHVDVTFYLSHVAAIIREQGWLPRSRCPDGQGTATYAWISAWDAIEHRVDGFQPEDRELAAAALDWARDLEPGNDYEANLRAAARQSHAADRTIGILASTIAGYQRHLERARETEQNAATSHHLGTVGQRLELAVECIGAFNHVGVYGMTRITKLRDAAGNVLVWFSSARDELQPGRRYIGRGTVKKHDTRDDVAQTVVTRCTFRPAE